MILSRLLRPSRASSRSFPIVASSGPRHSREAVDLERVLRGTLRAGREPLAWGAGSR